jgi:hypothetical protein
MSRYSYKKHYEWSPDIAYLTGLFASDGCLVNNGRHLNITSKDMEIISYVQRVLDFSVKVPMKFSSYNGSAYHLQFSNVALYDFLLLAGLTPAKSKTIGPICVPDDFFVDFLRGYFDGDGTVYGYWDKRWPNSLMYYTGYTSASPAFMQWLQQMNQRLIGTTVGKIKPGGRAMTLTYAKADSKKLFVAMYHDQKIPKLTRKYDKFVAFLRADPYASKELSARVL